MHAFLSTRAASPRGALSVTLFYLNPCTLRTMGIDDVKGVVVLEVIQRPDAPVHNEAQAAHGDADQKCYRPPVELSQRIVLVRAVDLKLALDIILLPRAGNSISANDTCQCPPAYLRQPGA